MVETEPERADLRLAATFVGVLVRPRATFAALAGEPNARAGASAVAVLGMVWGVLCFVLWQVGHTPPVLFVPVPPEDWFLVQGLLSLPILTGLWWLFSEVSHRLARSAGGRGAEGATRAALGFAYAAPMLLHVVAELIGLAGGGVDGLRAVARISMPASALGALVLSGEALRVLHRLPAGRAYAAAFAGLLVQALAGALVLR